MGIVASGSALLHAAGCNDDKGLPPPVEAGLVERVVFDSGLECVADPPVMQILGADGNRQDADWSCYAADAGFAAPQPLGPLDASDDADGATLLDDAAADAAEDADAGAPVDAGTSARVKVIDFVSLGPVPDVKLDLFFTNVMKPVPDFSGTTAAADAGASTPDHAGPGELLFPTPGNSLVAYRIAARTAAPALKEYVQFDNLPPRAGGVLKANSITEGGFTLLAAGILGTTQPVPGTTLVVSAMRDCQDRDVNGAIFELVDDASGRIITSGPGPNDIRTTYFNTDRFPDLRCQHTVAQQSLWVALNMPIDKSFTYRVKGRMTASDTVPKLIGTRKVELIPDAIVASRAYRLTKN